MSPASQNRYHDPMNERRYRPARINTGGVFACALCACLSSAAWPIRADAGDAANPSSGHAIVNESDIPEEQPGPHDGGGTTTAWPFFDGEPGLELVFRKRALHPRSGIGYHLHDKDEVYYVLSGRGTYTLNGEEIEVGPGMALLTRPGDSHGLKVLGDKDLVIFIVYREE